MLQTLAVGDAVDVDVASSSSSAATSQPTLVNAKVTSIDPAVDPATGLGQVDINLPAGAGFVPGQSVRLHVITAEHKDVLTAPTESVARDASGQPSISAIERDFRWAVRHPVVVGLRDGGRVEISGAGIHEGLDVVTTGAQALPDESLIEVVR